MSAIPKIKLSVGRKKEHASMPADCSTTANFGTVQPTFCREMIPNSSFKMSVASRVLLTGMPVPTFGRISMEHRHLFVPYRDVCPQFDSFIANQPYSPTTGVSYYPEELPELKLQKISQYILGRWADISIYKLTGDASINPIPIQIPADKSLTLLKAAWDDVIYINEPIASTGYKFYNEEITPAFRVASRWLAPLCGTQSRGITGDRQGRLLLGDYYVSLDNTTPSTDAKFIISENSNGGAIYPNPDGSMVTMENADYISMFGQSSSRYLICFRLTPVGKRIRQVLVGLGYQLIPNINKESCNWLKLLAYYKAWFSSFRPKRDISFNSTACYNLIKLMENPESVIEDEQMLYEFKPGTSGVYGYCYSPTEIVRKFIDDLGLYCSYYLPMDYFSAATDLPNENYQGADDSMDFLPNPVTGYYTSDEQQNIIINGNYYQTPDRPTVSLDGGSLFADSPLMQKVAARVLKYVNKNTIAGRSAADFIKVHFGISLDSSHDLDKVYEIGRSSTNIEVAELMNTAATDQMELGEFAGRGKGGSKSEEFYFENGDMHGVWLTLSTIVPHSGFYQGILKENDARKRFDFFTPEFDAAGYQVLSRSEVTCDFPVSNGFFNPTDSNTGANVDLAFGFIPRYSHLKVGRNIVNGDFSLRGYRNSMSGYTLDRMIPYDNIQPAYVDGEPVNVVTGPTYKVTTVNDGFRRIDPSDHIGNYNRIFYYAKNDFDHFLINCVFIVDAEIPALSLSDSFDTLSDEGKVIEMTHA